MIWCQTTQPDIDSIRFAIFKDCTLIEARTVCASSAFIFRGYTMRTIGECDFYELTAEELKQIETYTQLE